MDRAVEHISGTTPGETSSQAHDSGEPQSPDAGSPAASQSAAQPGGTSGLTNAGPGAAAAGPADAGAPGSPPAPAAASPAAESAPAQASAGFRSRGRMRRRARFLRKARELAYRDLGGLVFNLHRFGQRNDTLVLAKLNLIGQIDSELRTLEAALRERRPITVLREAGITACARCAAIHSSEDRFCPNCGLSMGRHADLPIGGTQAAGADTAAVAQPPAVSRRRAPARCRHPRLRRRSHSPRRRRRRRQAPLQPGTRRPPGPPRRSCPGRLGRRRGPRRHPREPALRRAAARRAPGGRSAEGSGSRGRSPTPPSFDAAESLPVAPAEPPRAEPPPAGGDHDPPAPGEDTEILRPSQGS